MDKIITIDGREVGFKASALTPRLYRAWLGRDMIADMNKLSKAFSKAQKITNDMTEEEKTEAQLKVADLEVFENCAWVMARHYDKNVADNPDDWLDTFTMFSIYEILPILLELWAINNQTTSTPKKK